MKNSKHTLLRYNAELINQSVPIADVIERYTDIRISKGSCKCPNPKHQDDTPSAHIYESSNRCYCFGCQTSFTPITAVIKIFDMGDNGFPEACEKLINDFGLSLEQCSNISEIEKAEKAENGGIPCFPLTASECALINIHGAFKTSVANPFYEELLENEETGEFYASKIQPKAFKVKSLPELWEETPQEIAEMLINKCDESIEKFKEWSVEEMSLYNALYESKGKAYIEEALKIEEAFKRYPNAKSSAKQFDKYYCLTNLREYKNRYEEYTMAIDTITKIKERVTDILENTIKHNLNRRKERYWQEK